MDDLLQTFMVYLVGRIMDDPLYAVTLCSLSFLWNDFVNIFMLYFVIYAMQIGVEWYVRFLFL